MKSFIIKGKEYPVDENLINRYSKKSIVGMLNKIYPNGMIINIGGKIKDKSLNNEKEL